MYDTVLRMIDAQGDEVAAAEFMPAALRNRLLRAIDRWVIGASLAFCAKTPLDCVFVKLSAESIIDKTLDRLARESRRQRGRRAAPAVLPGQRGKRDAVPHADAGARGAATLDGPSLRDRELRRRPRLGPNPRADADGLPQDRRLADAEHRERPRAARRRCASTCRPRRTARFPSSRSASRTPTRWPCCSSSASPTCKATTSTSPRSCSRTPAASSALSRSTVRQPRGNAMPRRPRPPA